MDVFVARQPIFDRSRELYAYELLFRSDDVDNRFDGTEAGSATTQVIANSLLTIGLENVAGGKKATFIIASRRYLPALQHREHECSARKRRCRPPDLGGRGSWGLSS